MRMVNNTYKSIVNFLPTALVLVLGLLISNTTMGQCPMVCNNLIQISLSSDCSATITPDMVLEGADDEIATMSCEFFIILYDENGDEIERTTYGLDGAGAVITTHPEIDGDYVGQTIEIGIWADDMINDYVDVDLANNCWSMAKIEYKIPSLITCPTDAVVIPCYEDPTLTEIMAASSVTDDVDITIVAGAVLESAITTVDATVTNEAEEYELINIVTVDILAVVDASATPSVAIDDADLLVSITSPDGSIVAVSQNPDNGGVIFNDFVGVQATDAFMNGDWTITVSYIGSESTYEITDLSLEIASQSALSNVLNLNNCDDGSITIVSDVSFDTNCRDASEPYTSRRLITFNNEDGGTECILTINYEKTTLDQIEAPDDIRISCADDSNNDMFFDDIFVLYDKNDDGVLSPTETGVPTIDGQGLFPMDIDNPCKFNVSVTDQEFKTCVSDFRILRTFTIYDWCNAEVREIAQTIQQVDDVAPVIVCPSVQTASFDADASGCTATFTLDPLGVNGSNDLSVVEFLSDCSAGYEVMAVGYKEANEDGSQPGFDVAFEYKDRVIDNGDGTYTLQDLEGPRVWIQYIIADACGNVVTFPIVDESNQTANCTFEVDIVDTTPPIAVCDEFTGVTLSEEGWARVYAESLDDGSYDYCSVVSFQARRIVQSECTELSLSADNHDDLVFDDFVQLCCDDLGDTVYVELLVTDANLNTSTCTVKVIAQDKSAPSVVSCPTSSIALSCSSDFIMNDTSASGPTLDDNCGYGDVFPRDSGSRDDCGVGTITRSWFLRSDDGRSSISLGCTQTYTFSLETITDSDITYPSNLTGSSSVEGCMQDAISPDDTGYPTYRGGVLIEDAPGCGNIEATYSDQVFSDVEEACFKILRKWTVIDWCEYKTTDPTGDGYYVGYQTIMLNNEDAPTFVTCGTDKSEYSLPDGSCETSVSLSASAIDGCTGLTITEPNRYTWSLTTPDGVETGVGLSTSQTLGQGSYTINWSVVGACDVTETCSSSFSVEDNIAPIPYCRGGITTVILPTSDSVEIWASDLDLGSSDQCDNPVSLTFENGRPNMTFTCDDVGDNDVVIVVEDPSGNTDICITTVTIQVNNGACELASRIMIGGSVMTESFEAIMDVEVSLEHMGNLSMAYDMSLEDGNYTFEDILSLEDYHLKANKLDDPRNGISTLDIILIQRHLLNIQPLSSSYQVIAADANNSQTITAADMVDIRKLILEIYDEFPSNKSWRFVDADASYNDAMNPWPLQEEILIRNILSDDADVNWTGVKVGDVDGSVTLEQFSNNAVDTRNSQSLNLEIREIEDGIYQVTNTEDIDLTGLQLELMLDNVTSIASEVLDLRSEHYNIGQQNVGLSYSQLSSVRLPASSVLFTISADAANVLELGENITSEAYNENLEILSINLIQSTEVTELALHQNKPNPFSGVTQISFDIPSEGSTTLEIMDINGRIVYSVTQQLPAGHHTQRIDGRSLPNLGLMYYRLNFEGEFETKKMILLD